MDPEDRDLSGSSQEVASFLRSFHHPSKSTMLSMFFSVLRSGCTGHRCSALELVWVAGVCLSSLASHSCTIEVAPVVLRSSPDHHCSVLASETLVSGASESSGGRPNPSSFVSRPPETVALPLSSSGDVRAVSSCVETIQRLARSQGFSSNVAMQPSLVRRSSSRADYQAKGAVYRQWCLSKGHSISHPFLSKVTDFLVLASSGEGTVCVCCYGIPLDALCVFPFSASWDLFFSYDSWSLDFF